MAVLVTGGAGYIGSHMALRLGDAGEETIVVDNLVTGFDWAIDPRATLIEGDAGDMAFMGEVIARHGIREIIHFAGSIVVPESVVDPLKYYRNNTQTSRNLLEAAVRGGVERFIFSSTAAVYGMTGLAPVEETTPLLPMSPYGRSKLMTEWMLADVAAAHQLKYGVLRYFNVAGADPRALGAIDAARHPPHQGGGADGAGPARQDGHFRHRLRDADGTCVRDYIRHRPDRGACAAARASAGRRRQRDAQRLWRGYSVRVIDTVKPCRASISASTRARAGRATRPRSPRRAKRSAPCWAGCRRMTR